MKSSLYFFFKLFFQPKQFNNFYANYTFCFSCPETAFWGAIFIGYSIRYSVHTAVVRNAFWEMHSVLDTLNVRACGADISWGK